MRRIDLDLVLEPELHLGRELVPDVHADDEVHQVDRLVDRLEARRARPDVLGDLLEAEVPVDRGTGVVGGVDGALLQRREHLAARQQRRLGADRREAFGDHAAGNAQLQVLEVLDRADRLLRVDDVRAVVDAVDVDTGPAWRRSRAPSSGRPCCRRRCPTRADSAGPSGRTTGTRSPESCRPSTRVNEFIASSTPFFTPSSSSKSPTTSLAANGLNSSSPPVFSLIVSAQVLNVLRPTPAGHDVCTFQVVVVAASALRIYGAAIAAPAAVATPAFSN